MPHAKAVEVVDIMLSTIERALVEGEEVRLSGFGAFVTAVRKAAKGRHPRTGETIDIPSSVAVKFRAGRGLKVAVARAFEGCEVPKGG